MLNEIEKKLALALLESPNAQAFKARIEASKAHPEGVFQ